MTNEEILKKAIEKAVGNGHDFYPIIRRKLQLDVFAVYDVGKLLGEVKIVAKTKDKGTFLMDYEILIFSHDFAKAFWGEREEENIYFLAGSVVKDVRAKWKFHLQQMVLEEDPIKYLEKFL